MAFILSNFLFGSGVSMDIARASAEGMMGSFVAAGALIVLPAASFLLWVSQKDSLERGR